MDTAALYQQALWSALAIAGGEQELARRLHVPLPELRGWLRGVEPPPRAVFFAAVDLIVDPEAPVVLPRKAAMSPTPRSIPSA